MDGYSGEQIPHLLAQKMLTLLFLRTWKAEEADEWSYQKGLEGGWIPKDPSERLYPKICG